MTDPVSGQLPWHANWGPERVRGTLVVACILAIIMTLGFIFVIAKENREGTLEGALFGAVGAWMGAMFICVVLPYLRVRRRKLPTDIGTADGGLQLRFRRHVYFSLAGLFIVGAVLLTFPLLGSILRVENREDSVGTPTAAMMVQAVMLGLTVLVVVLLAGYMLIVAVGRNGMVISESGVEIYQARVRRVVCWDNVRDVVPFQGNAGPAVRIVANSLGSISVESFKGTRRSGHVPADMQVHPQALGIDPPTLLYVLRFYLNNPEKRGELSSSASIDRIRSLNLLG